MPNREHTLIRLLRERGHHLTDPNLWARARAEALATETGMPDDKYPPESIRVLAGLEPRKPGVLIGIEDCYPFEDGPGSGTRVELSVSVLVGTERSTVIVADPLTGRALVRELVHHGRGADVAAAAVEAAIRASLPSDPGGVPGGSSEALGEPRE